MRVKILFSSDVANVGSWKAPLSRAVRQALKAAAFPRSCEVSILVTNDVAIRELNRTWRHIDSATDVLSFSQLEGEHVPDTEGSPIGDLVISLETASRRAQQKQVPLDAEMALLAAHGTLHLLGYDHHRPGPRRIMRAKEGQILAELGFDPTVVGREIP